jgi:hypothetical protein
MPKHLDIVTPDGPCVYFLLWEGRVKIGTTQFLRRRLLEHRWKLKPAPVLLGFVRYRDNATACDDERGFHQKWQGSKIRRKSEWFTADHKILIWIDSVIDQPGPNGSFPQPRQFRQTTGPEGVNRKPKAVINKCGKLPSKFDHSKIDARLDRQMSAIHEQNINKVLHKLKDWSE